ncbi:hypothetical protein AMS69_08070 [Haloarcula rubripromontorii]|uniref:DUF3592 domain-containing protein n=1 Tax=Haloarcula rubripromontorii TaxID=1705562 RepID=A0A0M9AMI6_9EURY|nr:DUF3592 domain-containing protein [Haloarcula rubripromontorii]KOX93865.1 hypothetical protein AMS69_08070 [Haloarcula rubripromontorii]
MSEGTGFSINGPETLRGAVLLVLVGLLMTGYGAYDYAQQSSALTNAVEVDAELVEKGVETSSGGRRSGVSHRPTVRYTYEYDGTAYTSTNVFPANIAPTYDTEDAARSVLDGYETGATVTVYVPPGDPDDAYLKHQESNAPLLAVGIGLFFVIFSGVSAVRNL